MEVLLFTLAGQMIVGSRIAAMHQYQEPRLSLRLAVRLRALLFDYDFEYAELLVGATAFLWGAWLFNPAWETFTSTPTFQAMSMLAPEWLWGLAIGLLGAAQVGALLLDAPRWRARLSLVLCAVWLLVSILFAAANFRATSTVVYPLFASSAAWSYLRLKVRYR